MEVIAQADLTVRLGFYVGMFSIIALWEVAWPARRLICNKAKRWTRNVLMAAVSSAMVRILVPLTAVEAATFAESNGIGLLNGIDIGRTSFGVVLAVLMLDCCIYLQHVSFHYFPFLWRLHRVHHADQDFDVTTGSRFHPAEIVLSMLIKCVVIITLGASPFAVLIFEVLLNVTAMFNHGNVSLPPGLDKLGRWIVVTPDMHRIHHSEEFDESNSNYGFSLSWWDRLFGTYLANARLGSDEMVIGLKGLKDEDEFLPVSALKMPLVGNERPAQPNLHRTAYLGVGLVLVCSAYSVSASIGG